MRVHSFFLLILLLAGCSLAPNRAPVEERGQPPDERIHHHIVEPGDTLYSIAWRYGLDYRRLAAANQIRAPFTIRRGQKLHIAEADPPASTARREALVAPRASSKSRTTVQKKRTKTVQKSATGARPDWQWPVRGQVIQGFSTTGAVNKGVDIKGKLREPVKSAASGRVVYSGSGIRGYGNLVIIKHSDEFLSAYAHNHRILVAESETVEPGQVIAEMGRDASGAPVLHFEIRRNGKPVNPLNYLPR